MQLQLADVETVDQLAAQRIGLFARVNGAPLPSVMTLDYLFQSGDGAVVHVRCSQRDIAQAGRTKLTHVLGATGKLDQSDVARRVRPSTVLVIQSGIVKTLFRTGDSRVSDVISKVETAVELIATHPAAEKERLATARGRADGVLVSAVFVAIVV